jgi:hypothetical protein
MNAETLSEVLKRSPFEPFQVLMSSGEVHEIRHPEFAMATPGRLVIADPATERIAILSMFHITELRMLQPAA